MQEKLRLLEQMIDERGLSAAKARIMALVRPAIALIPDVADENEIPLGSTKLWGLPHVPPGFDWPKSEGMVLGFLGQVNLAELKNCYDLGLPSHGLLSFWFHQGLENGIWSVWGKVFHFHDSALTLLEWPKDSDRHDMSWVFEFSNTTWKASMIVFPSLPYDYYIDNVYQSLLNLSEDESDIYCELQSELDEVFDLPRNDYQIGGYPHRCQCDPQRYIYLYANNIKESDFDEEDSEAMTTMLNFAQNLRLLAQFDANNEDISDQSEASIYFFYPEANLAQHDFENPYLWWDFES
ncbi:MAG: DUF1963 domain-containing protein [Elainellaceae cyanobacterium]